MLRSSANQPYRRLLTPFAQRVKGLKKVTNADLNLAPQEASYHVASAAFVEKIWSTNSVSEYTTCERCLEIVLMSLLRKAGTENGLNRGDLKLGILPRIEICD